MQNKKLDHKLDQNGDPIPLDLVILKGDPLKMEVEDANDGLDPDWFEMVEAPGLILVSKAEIRNPDLVIDIRDGSSPTLELNVDSGTILKVNDSLKRFNWTKGFYHS